MAVVITSTLMTTNLKNQKNINHMATEPQQVQTDDQLTAFAKTRDAIDNAQTSFSDKLTELYKAREAARVKRQRTAEKRALGHALGDLFGAIGAHFISKGDNSPAVIAEPLAPKSYAKVQSLIDEGVADAKTFDQYLLSLTQKKGENDITMAKAQDKAAVDLAIQKRKDENARLDREAKAQAAADKRTFDAEQAELNRKNQKDIAEISAGAKGKTTGKKGLENWQRVAALVFIDPMTTSSTTTTDLTTGMASKADTQYKRQPTREEMENAFAQAENLAKQWGITLSEANVNEFKTLKSLIGKKYINQQGKVKKVDNSFIKTYLTNGIARGNQLSELVQKLETEVR